MQSGVRPPQVSKAHVRELLLQLLYQGLLDLVVVSELGVRHKQDNSLLAVGGDLTSSGDVQGVQVSLQGAVLHLDVVQLLGTGLLECSRRSIACLLDLAASLQFSLVKGCRIPQHNETSTKQAAAKMHRQLFVSVRYDE